MTYPQTWSKKHKHFHSPPPDGINTGIPMLGQKPKHPRLTA